MNIVIIVGNKILIFSSLCIIVVKGEAHEIIRRQNWVRLSDDYSFIQISTSSLPSSFSSHNYLTTENFFVIQKIKIALHVFPLSSILNFFLPLFLEIGRLPDCKAHTYIKGSLKT